MLVSSMSMDLSPAEGHWYPPRFSVGNFLRGAAILAMYFFASYPVS